MSFRQLLDYSQPLVAAATVLAAGIVITVCIGGYTAYKIKLSVDTVEVTGSAKQAVTADFGRWTISLDTKTGVSDQQTGFDRLDKATTRIVTYLKGQGFEDIETPSASTMPDYYYSQNAPPQLSGYIVNRTVIVRSADIDKIATLANSIAPLSGQGYNVTTGGVELTYQKLDEMRVTLLSAAIKDAEARAEAIAKESGRSVGVLRSATGGVVQVLPKGGIDVSDYGSYDTQSREKEVMVTVRATFRVQ